MKKIDEIRENPYTVSKRLAGPFKDKRKTRVGGYRIIFKTCEECRREQSETFLRNPCAFCSQVQDDTIVFLNVKKRAVSYR